MVWLIGWTYRKNHVINPASDSGTNYQMGIKVYYGSGEDGVETVFGVELGKVYCDNKCKTDFGDIRFTRLDKESELDYWIEEKVNSEYAIFWVKMVDDLSSVEQIIYIYYGKSDAVTTSNFDNTMRYGDDFENCNLNRWTINDDWLCQDTTVKIGSYAGEATLADKLLVKEHTDYIVKAVDFWMRSPVTNNFFYLYEKFDATPKSANIYMYNNGFFGFYITSMNYITTYASNTWYRIKLFLKGSTVYDIKIYNADGSLRGSRTNVAYCSFDPEGLKFFPDNALGLIDNVFVRKYVDPEPSHGDWGIEEEYHEPVTYKYNVPIIRLIMGTVGWIKQVRSDEVIGLRRPYVPFKPQTEVKEGS